MILVFIKQSLQLKSQSKILGDYKRQGKKLVPPLIAVGNFRETSYVDKVIPEIMWIAILIEMYGLKKGTEIGLEFVSASSRIINNSDLFFAFISSYECIDNISKQALLVELNKSNVLVPLRKGLENFLSIYPSCPLAFILDKPIGARVDIVKLKNILVTLYDKRSVTATFALGNVVYYMGVLGKLKFDSTTSLAQLPKLIDYPNTQISRVIASSIRASINVLIQPSLNNNTNNWNKYFWNRGLEIEPCVI